MIFLKPGEEFWHEGVCYKVGGRIVANEVSDYAGLFGNILEIRTEDDRETDNDTPDIYCAFEAPVLSANRLALEQTFSQLYHEQKHIEDLGLDMVIMGPEMIAPLEHAAQAFMRCLRHLRKRHEAVAKILEQRGSRLFAGSGGLLPDPQRPGAHIRQTAAANR